MVVDDDEEIPELLRSFCSNPPPAPPPSAPPSVTRIAPVRARRTFGEEVVINKKDPRREED